MNNKLTKTWRQYEAGKEHKRRISLYETVRRNERYYRGEQWGSVSDLPKPVFNIVRRVADYLICTVGSGKTTIHYSDDNLPFARSKEEAKLISDGVDAMTKNASYRWERCKMDHTVLEMLRDAAISGDGVLYCYWDPNAESGQLYSGDIVTETIDSTNVFPADVNRADIQSQEYVILSGRASVNVLRSEAKAEGVSADEIQSIVPDEEVSLSAGDMGTIELSGGDSEKATYLIKFWRENGLVCFEKSTRSCVIKRVKTGCRLYPIAFFNWCSTKNSFHGTSPISSMIPNQDFVNRAYAMVMKHMTDTAFSKVIYDKTKIPEWSNKVGEAIAAVGGGNMSDAVSVVGVGQLQNGYMDIINKAVEMTKELGGATESALGNVIPNNTSAILALQESTRIPLELVRGALSRCIEDLANIWADMMCAYYPAERLLPYGDRSAPALASADFPLLSGSLVRATVELGAISTYSESGVVSILDKLLDGGHITAKQYVEQLPTGSLPDRDILISMLSEEQNKKEEPQDE